MYQRKRTRFTEDDIRKLSRNVYVKSVTLTTVNFTEEFKRFFSEENRKGRTAAEIFREAGIDPEIVGKDRISAFRSRIKILEKGGDFSDKRLGKKETKNGVDSLKDRIAKLERDIETKKSELECLRNLVKEMDSNVEEWENRWNKNHN